MAKINKKEHIEIHVKLHKCLDELVANWIRHNDALGGTERKSLTNTTIMELMNWAYAQTILPDEE